MVPLTLSPLSWGRVRKALKKVDVVHIHEPLVPLVGWFALSTDKPLVATFHADPPDWARRLYPRLPWIGRRLRRGVVTAVSEVAAGALPESWGPIEIIPNAIDVAAYNLPVGRVDRRVCFLGRDDPRKGLDVLLAAWPRIREAVPNATLQVMGADRDTRVDGVEFLGRVTGGEKNRILASSLVYAAPNTGGESFGIVLAEAMAAGCAVVCTDLDAFKAVVGENALLVPVGDPESLAKAIIELLEDPERAREMGERARRAVERFDWGVIATRYQLMYRRAMGDSSPKPSTMTGTEDQE